MQSRRLRAVPTASAAAFCVATVVLSLAAHLVVEQPLWPASTLGWASILALGRGPVGLAIYVWDVGVRNGDIQLLGVLPYAALLLSTITLLAAGMAAPQ